MERLVRSGDCLVNRCGARIENALPFREPKRPDPESVSRSHLRDSSNSDIRWGRTMSFKSSVSTLTLTFLLGLPASAALAQSTPLNTLPEIVISPTALPVPSDQVGSSVTVITEEQIRRDQRRTLPELLATVPGLNVVQTGGPGGQTSIFMRGMNADHVKVLVDGVDVSDPSAPKRVFDFGPMMTDDIERVEILRGPQSGLYGADAMGGVISITTKKGSGPAKWTAMAEGGSFGTFNQSAQVSGGTDNTNYAFTFGHNRVSGTPVTPLDLLAPGEKRNNDFYDNYTYSGKYGAEVNDIFSYKFAGRYTDTKLRYTNDDFSNYPNVFPNADQSRSVSRQFSGFGEGTWKLLDGRFNNRIGYSYLDISRRTVDPSAAWVPYDGQRGKIYWNSDFAITSAHKLLMGVEREDEKARTSAIDRSNSNTGAYAQLQSAFSDRFFVASNIRHDENDAFGGHNTWRIAPAFLIPETGTKLKASYGTGFHAPSLAQLYAPPSGNSNLKPEESEGYDFGFEQSFWQKRLQFGVTYFNNKVKNLINFGPAPNYTNENIDRAKTHGLEAFVSAQITNRFQVRADYTRTIATNADTGEYLQRRPKDKTSVSAVYQPTDKLTLSATALWVSGWYDFDRFGFAYPAFKTSGYHIVNLAVNYAMNDNVTVFGRIDNLLNEHYQVPIGFEKPGIGVYAGLRMTR
jgi:vitamin B12 transporter